MITVTSSTPTSRWQRHEEVKSGTGRYELCLASELQEVEGFGAAFNELGWKALTDVPLSVRDEVTRRTQHLGVGAELHGDPG